MRHNKNARGMVCNVQRFSLDDGPGIRSTVFLKGCNLKCQWCHNPECISKEKELQYTKNTCISCGLCEKSCPCGALAYLPRSEGAAAHVGINRKLCTLCGQCCDVCPTKALSILGTYKSPHELVEELLKDHSFFKKSGGGVTISGGEPLLQKDFCLEVLGICKDKGIHTAIDTAGCLPFETLKQAGELVQLFLYDIKMIDEAKHWHYVGGENKQIIQNLVNLCQENVRIWLRMPVIKDVNDDEETAAALIALLKNCAAVQQLDLLPYHSYGLGKYAMMGYKPPPALKPPESVRMLRLLDVYKSAGINARCDAMYLL